MPCLKILPLHYITFRMTRPFFLKTLNSYPPVIPSVVEESYAVPQDPCTALGHIQDDETIFSRNSKLLTGKPQVHFI